MIKRLINDAQYHTDEQSHILGVDMVSTFDPSIWVGSGHVLLETGTSWLARVGSDFSISQLFCSRLK